MRKSFLKVQRRIYFILLTFSLLGALYLTWFIFPYLSFFFKAGLLKAFLYPTSALIRNVNNIVTITLYGTGTTVLQYNLVKQQLVIIRSQKKLAQISKSKGYYIIFPDKQSSELEISSAILHQLGNWRLILGRQRYVALIQQLDQATKKNISLIELAALWRTYFFHRSIFTVREQ